MVFVDFGYFFDVFEKIFVVVCWVILGKVLMLFGVDGDCDVSKWFDMVCMVVEGSDIFVVIDYYFCFEDFGFIWVILIEGVWCVCFDVEIYEVFLFENVIVMVVGFVGEGDVIFWVGLGY